MTIGFFNDKLSEKPQIPDQEVPNPQPEKIRPNLKPEQEVPSEGPEKEIDDPSPDEIEPGYLPEGEMPISDF